MSRHSRSTRAGFAAATGAAALLAALIVVAVAAARPLGLAGHAAPLVRAAAAAHPCLVMTGSGDATVWARDNLSVKIAGSGDVKYYGRPAISRSIAGSERQTSPQSITPDGAPSPSTRM